MEYVDGDTLSHLRARQPNLVFDAAALQRYAAELCEALEYAHTRAKIVHRDIKPSNLMVNSRDETKIADFGIARSLTDSVSMLTKTRHTSGTLLYMSPQQLEGEPTSPLDDVYSVGAVLYELLTSKPPFYRGQIDHQIRTKPVVPIVERRSELGIEAPPVPPAWERTVAACLAKNPADRPQSAAEIARALSREALEIQKVPVIPVNAPAAPLPVTEKLFLASSNVGARRGIGPFDPKKWAYAAAALTGMILIACLIYYVGLRVLSKFYDVSHPEQAKPSPFASPAKPETGTVVVNTVPADASVYLDGSDRGKTPLVIDDVSPGIHHVSIEANGYLASSLIADVKNGGTFDFGTIHLMAMAAPSPSPTSTSVPESSPHPPLAVAPPAPTRDLNSEITTFVYEHLRKSVNADINGLLADYADRVDYYENGYVDHSFIAKDRQTYSAGWPAVKIVPFGPVRSTENANANRVTIWFDYRFDARNNKGIHSLGDTANTWVLDTSYGALKIVSEKQTVTNRKRTR
jgi:serine/threonine protein kinase